MGEPEESPGLTPDELDALRNFALVALESDPDDELPTNVLRLLNERDDLDSALQATIKRNENGEIALMVSLRDDVKRFRDMADEEKLRADHAELDLLRERRAVAALERVVKSNKKIIHNLVTILQEVAGLDEAPNARIRDLVARLSDSLAALQL